MKYARPPWLPLLRALALLGLGSGWAMACGGPQEPGAAGSVCFRSDDCKVGLACVPSAPGSSKNVCAKDLSVILPLDGAAATAPPSDASGGADGSSSAGSAIGGTPSGGAPAAGAPGSAGAASGGTATAGSSSNAGSGGSAVVDAGDG